MGGKLHPKHSSSHTNLYFIVNFPDDSTVTILFNCLTVSVTEGSVVNIQLIAQGTYNQEFTVNLMFTSVTAGMHINCTVCIWIEIC